MEAILPLLLGGIIGFFAVLFSQMGGDPGGTGKKGENNKDICDGDCASCPDHFGFRHDKWHFGHGHEEGCERDGNGGADGKCYRD